MYDMQQLANGLKIASAIAAILTRVNPVAGVVAAVAGLLALKAGTLLGGFSTARSHSDGKLIFFLDIWGAPPGYLYMGFWKTFWFDDGREHWIVTVPEYEFMPGWMEALKAWAHVLPADWTWAGYYSGVL